MKILWVFLTACLVCCPGCFWRNKDGKKANSGEAGVQKLIVTPETGLVAQVVRVNPNGRFVVLTLPLGQMPAAGRILSLYRRGLKAGEVRVTTHQRDDSVVADIIAGDALVGDEARDK